MKAFGLGLEWHVSGSEKPGETGWLQVRSLMIGQCCCFCAFPRGEAHPLEAWASLNICATQGQYLMLWCTAYGHLVFIMHGYQQPSLGA